MLLSSSLSLWFGVADFVSKSIVNEFVANFTTKIVLVTFLSNRLNQSDLEKALG